MANTGTPALDNAIKLTNEWLKEIETVTGLDRDTSWRMLRGTLQALRDRMAPEEVPHLGAQLPLVVRGAYYEGWAPAKTPVTLRHTDDFLDLVREKADPGPDRDLAEIVRGVFRVLDARVTDGQAGDARLMLNDEIKDDLWPRTG